MYSLKDFFVEAKMNAADVPEWFSGIALTHPTEPDFRPRFHQVTGLNLIFLYSRTALYDEMGTGKTLPAQAAMLWDAAQGNRVIALMPPLLLSQFRDSFNQTFVDVESHLDIEVYHGSPTQREALAAKWMTTCQQPGAAPHIVLTTPELFRKEFALFKQLDFNALVCDECKYWANPESHIYRAIENFLGPVGEKRLVGMNGTPAKNNLADLYGYNKMVTPMAYPSKQAFYNQHVITKKIPVRYKKKGAMVNQEIRVIDSFRNLDLLYKNTFKQARRVEKKDVAEIPPLQIIDFDFELHPAHAKAYQEFCRAKVMEFEDGSAISGEQTATMRQLAMQSVVNKDILHIEKDSAVLDAIEELLEEMDVQTNKVYIGGYYNKTIEMIGARFAKLEPALIYGGHSSKNPKEIQRFRNDPACRLGVANYQSGGVGLNLQDVCKYAIAAEPTTVPGDFSQWTGRIDRTGQKHKTTIYVLRPKGTIWIKAIESMRKKTIWNNSVVTSGELMKELLGV